MFDTNRSGCTDGMQGTLHSDAFALEVDVGSCGMGWTKMDEW